MRRTLRRLCPGLDLVCAPGPSPRLHRGRSQSVDPSSSRGRTTSSPGSGTRRSREDLETIVHKAIEKRSRAPLSDRRGTRGRPTAVPGRSADSRPTRQPQRANSTLEPTEPDDRRPRRHRRGRGPPGGRDGVDRLYDHHSGPSRVSRIAGPRPRSPREKNAKRPKERVATRRAEKNVALSLEVFEELFENLAANDIHSLPPPPGRPHMPHKPEPGPPRPGGGIDHLFATPGGPMAPPDRVALSVRTAAWPARSGKARGG